MTTASSVEQALQLSPAEVGEALAALPEDQWLERKSAGVGGQTIANLLVGFANAEGGVIIIGLSDDGVVEGIGPDVDKRSADWRRAATDFPIPLVRCQFQRIDCITAKGNPDQLVVITVESSDKVHVNNRDEVFLRVGEETRKLSFQQRQELLYDKGQASFEGTPAKDATLNDLDYSLLSSYADRLYRPDIELRRRSARPDGGPTYADRLSRSDTKRLLSARGLLDRNDRVTTAAVLLFATEPQRWLPEARLRVLRYRGSERGTGARQQLLSDIGIEGPIPHMINETRKAVLDQLPTRRALAESGRFEQIPLLPPDAWLEGLVNAIVHRSYSHSGDHIRVDIFDDRIEIESPGRFPGIFDLSDPLQVTRFARNPRIARVCADLRFGQELGEGIRRMFDEMKLAGLVDPEYRQTSGSVRLTLSWVAVDRDLDERLPRLARDLMRLIRLGDRLSTGDLAEATNRSRQAVLNQLRVLQREGLVTRVGKSLNDPRAYWKLSD